MKPLACVDSQEQSAEWRTMVFCSKTGRKYRFVVRYTLVDLPLVRESYVLG